MDGVERGIVDLAGRFVDEVRNPVLGRVIVEILGKLRVAMRGEFVRRMMDFGLERAGAVAALAVGWGSEAAAAWARDAGFARYLTTLDFYAPSGWGV